MANIDKKIDKLLAAATAARDRAYAPYSNFFVGAAVLSGTGNIYSGCNVENISYGLTICAERNAIFKMVSAGEREITAILIIGNTGDILPPCGACRQVMAEFSRPDTVVYMCDKQGKWQETTVGELLPNSPAFFEDIGHEKK